MDKKRRRKIIPEIDKRYDNQLGKTLENAYKFQDGATSISSLARLLEGPNGLVSQIAIAYKIDISGKSLNEQIKTLSEKASLPNNIISYLNNLRINNNSVKHENASYSVKEAEIFIQAAEFIFDWFYCKCDKGPKYPAIYESNTLVVAQVAYSKTILGLVDVGDMDNVKIKKLRILESNEFFHPQGFNFFRTTLSLFINGSNPDGCIISLSCPVNTDGYRQDQKDWQFWPKNIKDGLGFNIDTLVLNDAATFGFSEDIHKINDRALVITLGLGVGGSIIKNENGIPKIKAIEFSNESFTLSGFTGNIHSLIGGDYFDGITRGDHYDSDQVVGGFTRRVIEFVKILTKRYGIDKVIIGGYRSLFLTLPVLQRELNFERISISCFPDDEVVVTAMAKAWLYKYEENQNIYSTL